MNPETTIKEAEFLFRRLQDDMPVWAVGLPVVFALVVLGLLFLFNKGESGKLLVAAAGVALGSVVYVLLALLLRPIFNWWVVLAPVIGIALVYVALMYVRDAHSIHPAWAAFLGILRCTVYAILAFVFLLPGCQTYDTTETHAKVVMVFDVSDSMNTVDDLPTIGEDPAKLPSRQDKVLKFLTQDAKGKDAVLTRIAEKSPLRAYRFGSLLDDIHVLNISESVLPPVERWAEFLKPDKATIKLPETVKDEEERRKLRSKLMDLVDGLKRGTNIGGSALQVARLESGSYLQALIIISDGQSNQGSSEAIEEFIARVNNPKRPVNVFTVGVGEFRQPISIRIEDVQAPEVARPDDKFLVRVPVIGSGLNDEEVEVTLELVRIKDRDGKESSGEKKYPLPPKKAKFKGAIENPRDDVEFEIDVQALKGIKADRDEKAELEGTWQMLARVPRHKNEAFPKAEHVSEPTNVLVQKKKLRVLLFASGPMREYQFVRTLLYREVLEKRLDLTVYLQTGREEGVDQDVETERLLTDFPRKLTPSGPADKEPALANYDIIIAFDPDWTALDVTQLNLLKDWATNHAGAVVFVAGPAHTFNLARPGGLDLSSLLSLYPVVLKDSRLHGLGIGHDPTRPYYLNFNTQVKLPEFLKLDETGDSPTAGWQSFFWGENKIVESKDSRPQRGIFNYYPVEKLRGASVLLATFAGPPASRIEDGAKEQPFLVLLPVGSGKTLYIGSPEMWRLRNYKETYHERFWIKLARYMASGTALQKKYGQILMARNYTTGTISVEANIKGEDLQPLPRDSKPNVLIKRPAHFDAKLDPDTPERIELRPKSAQGEWTGTFVGSIKIRTPGEYELKIPVPGTIEYLQQTIKVKEPNPELDNLRPNYGALYRLASDARPLLNSLPQDLRRELERLLKAPEGEESGRSISETLERKDGEPLRLFFPLKTAEEIPRFLRKLQPQRESTKGALQDLWDKGFLSGYYTELFWLLLFVPLSIGVLAAAILLTLRQMIAALIVFVVALVFSALVALVNLTQPEWMQLQLDLDLSFVLITVVSLLGIEWLTRKLLKLA